MKRTLALFTVLTLALQGFAYAEPVGYSEPESAPVDPIVQEEQVELFSLPDGLTLLEDDALNGMPEAISAPVEAEDLDLGDDALLRTMYSGMQYSITLSHVEHAAFEVQKWNDDLNNYETATAAQEGETLYIRVIDVEDGYVVSYYDVKNSSTNELLGQYYDTFTMPDCPVTITPIVVLQEYLIEGHNAFDWDCTNVLRDGEWVSTAWVYYGDTVRVTFPLNDGWRFVDDAWQPRVYYVDGYDDNGDEIQQDLAISGSLAEGFTFTMPATGDVHWDAPQIERIPYTLSIADDIEHGTVSIAGDLTTACVDDRIVLDYRADAHYELYSFYVNDGSYYVGCDYDDGLGAYVYCFYMPAEDVTVSAEFTEIFYDLSCADMENGYIDWDYGAQPYGHDYEITVNYNAGYKLSEGSLRMVTDGGVDVPLTFVRRGMGWEDWSFTMPDDNVTVYAEFEEAAYRVAIDPANNQNGNTLTAECDFEEIDADSALAYGDYIDLYPVPADGYSIDLRSLKNLYTDDLFSMDATDDGDGNIYYGFTMPAADVEIQNVFSPNDYYVSIDSFEGGSARLTREGSDEESIGYAFTDETVTVHLELADGYALGEDGVTVRWTHNGLTSSVTATAVDGGNGLFTFTMPPADATVSIDVAPVTYSVTIVGAKEHGTISVSKQEANVGDWVTLSLTPDPGYHVTWHVSGGKRSAATVKNAVTNKTIKALAENDMSFEMPSADVTVNLLAKLSFTPDDQNINAVGANCAIEVANTAKTDSAVMFTIAPDEGYSEPDSVKVLWNEHYDGDSGEWVWDEWTVAQAGGAYTFVMPYTNVEIHASATPNDYSVSVAGDTTHGTVRLVNLSQNPDAELDAPMIAHVYECVKPVITPDDGYYVETWSVADDVTGNALSITGGWYDNDHYDNEHFYMPAHNVTVTAAFVPYTYAIRWDLTDMDAFTVDDGDEGTEGSTARTDSAVTFTLTPSEGYMLDSDSVKVLWNEHYDSDSGEWVWDEWTVAEDNGVYSFVMPHTDVKIQASGTEARYGIAVSEEIESGTVVPSLTEAAAGTSVTLTVTPDENYRLADNGLTVTGRDGEGVVLTATDSASAWTFIMPAQSVTVSARFAEGTDDTGEEFEFGSHKVMIDPDIEHGAISVDEASPNERAVVTLTVTPDEGYALVPESLTVTDEDMETVELTENGGGTWSFTMPECNVTVTAAFALIQHTVTFDPANGSDAYEAVVTGNDPVERPEDPVWKWHTFLGWFEDGSEEAYDFSGDVTADLSLTAHWEEVAHLVILRTATVAFSGEIRMDIKYDIPEAVLLDDGAYITFTNKGNGGTIESTQLLKDGTPDNSTGYMVYSVYVKAQELGLDFLIRLYDSDGELLPVKNQKQTADYTQGLTYSPKTYAASMATGGSTQKMRDLAQALLDYATAGQVYFKKGDYEGLAVSNNVANVNGADPKADYNVKTSGVKPDANLSNGIEVDFKADNTLRIIYRFGQCESLAAADCTFSLDNAPVSPKAYDGNWCIEVKNIKAKELGVVHTFTCTSGDKTYTIDASALYWAYRAAIDVKEATQNLGKALYLYSQKAMAYFAA